MGRSTLDHLAQNPAGREVRHVRIPPIGLAGTLCIPGQAYALAVFVHGSGSSRFSPRNMAVANALNEQGIATLLFDLLTVEEEGDRANVFNIQLLAERLVHVVRWLGREPIVGSLPLGLFGASTGAAAGGRRQARRSGGRDRLPRWASRLGRRRARSNPCADPLDRGRHRFRCHRAQRTGVFASAGAEIAGNRSGREPPVSRAGSTGGGNRPCRALVRAPSWPRSARPGRGRAYTRRGPCLSRIGGMRDASWPYPLHKKTSDDEIAQRAIDILGWDTMVPSDSI